MNIFLEMKKDLSRLLQDLRNIHEDFKLIPANEIEVADWVRSRSVHITVSRNNPFRAAIDRMNSLNYVPLFQLSCSMAKKACSSS